MVLNLAATLILLGKKHLKSFDPHKTSNLFGFACIHSQSYSEIE